MVYVAAGQWAGPLAQFGNQPGEHQGTVRIHLAGGNYIDAPSGSVTLLGEGVNALLVGTPSGPVLLAPGYWLSIQNAPA
jgi:hypothetical protein